MSTDLMVIQPTEASVSTPRKRTYDGELVTPSTSTPQGVKRSVLAKDIARDASPAPSDATSELTELTSTGLQSPAAVNLDRSGSSDPTNAGVGPSKKRKLTFAEKEVEKAVRRRDQEERARQKADEKARKEEEKRVRDEEKRRKEEEKELSKRAREMAQAEKQKARDAERLEKEAEKAKKDAEKKDRELERLKRERSQLRIGAFFGRPAQQTTPPTTPDDASSRASSRRSSIADIDMAEPVLKVQVVKPTNPDFESYIIPYFVHDNTELAPENRFKAARKTGVFGGQDSLYQLEVEKAEVEPLRTRFQRARRRLRPVEPVKAITERAQAVQIKASDLSDDYNPLAFVPYKILSFREDIRPPYTGTFTKRIDPNAARKMSRNSAYRGRIDTNYDYDSEAEWEEPAADDEEILDDEMSESEDGDEDMQDFLDDENDAGKRRLFASEMEPISSGLCFEGEEYDSRGHNMEDYRMDVLDDSTRFPIDPFSDLHWADAGRPTPARAKSEAQMPKTEQARADSESKSMPPPRMPLATVNAPNSLNGFLLPAETITVSQNENALPPAKRRGRAPNSDKPIKLVQPEFMDAFKQAIRGSDQTKAGLIEILKKQFPQCSKDAIKDTLGVVALRVGKKEAEKKWALI